MTAGWMRTLALAGALAVPGSFAEALTLYGAENFSNELFTIDTETGDVATVGPFGGGFGGVTGLAFDGAGKLYGVDTATDQLLGIDAASGAATAIGALGFGAVESLAFAPDGTLFAGDLDTDKLLTIDVATGAATAIGDFGFGTVTGLAFDAGGRLIGVDNDRSDGASSILEIDPATGSADELTTFGDRNNGWNALTLAEDGDLYILDGRLDRIFRLDDPDAGLGAEAAFFRSSGLTLSALAARGPAEVGAEIPLPAPAALLLLGMAALGAAGTRRKLSGSAAARA